MKTFLFLSDEWVYAIGCTLVHSLWQGAALAFAFALALPRLRGPVLRYWSAFGCLCALFVAALVTCYLIYEPAIDAVGVLHGSVTNLTNLPAAASATTWWQPVADWFEAQHEMLVGLWLTGFVLLLLRMLGGMWYLRCLSKAAEPLTGPLLAQFEVLSHKMGIQKAVRLASTAAMRSPAAFGWIRPVVLFPIGLLNQLSTAEVEAILAHELAHLVRRDWLMNLFQVLIEAVFYFHPAVWWLSGLVRTEREKCCDLMAIRYLGGDRIRYAKALVRVQAYAKERTAPTPALAMNATGTKMLFQHRRTQLLDRMQVILLQPSQQKSMLMERMLAATLLLVAFTIWGLQSAPALLPTALNEAESWMSWGNNLFQQDTIPKPMNRTIKTTIERSARTTIEEEDTKTGKKVKLEARDGQITALNVDGKEIPESDFGQYRDLTDRMLREVPPPPPPAAPGMISPPGVEGAEHFDRLGRFPPPPPPAAPGMPPPPPSPPGLEQGLRFSRVWDFPTPPPPPPLPGMIEVENRQDASGSQSIQLRQGGETVSIVVKDGKILVDGEELPVGSTRQLENLDARSLSLDVETFGAPDDIDGRLLMKQVEISQRINDVNAAQSDYFQQLERERNWVNRGQLEQQRAIENLQIEAFGRGFEEFPGGAPETMVSSIILAELKKDFLIPDINNYAVQLNTKKLKVNGKKQPENLHKKYLDIYRRYTGKEMTGDQGISFKVSR